MAALNSPLPETIGRQEQSPRTPSGDQRAFRPLPEIAIVSPTNLMPNQPSPRRSFQFRLRALLIVTLAISALLLACFAGCADNVNILTSKDNRVLVALPNGWEATLIPDAPSRAIQARSPDKAALVIVISEAKEDHKFKSLKEYADATMKIAHENKDLKDQVEKQPKKLTINGSDAIQYELSATEDGLIVRYLRTFIETDTRWNHVDAFTTPSHWDESQDDFRALYESLKEPPR